MGKLSLTTLSKQTVNLKLVPFAGEHTVPADHVVKVLTVNSAISQADTTTSSSSGLQGNRGSEEGGRPNSSTSASNAEALGGTGTTKDLGAGVSADVQFPGKPEQEEPAAKVARTSTTPPGPRSVHPSRAQAFHDSARRKGGSYEPERTASSGRIAATLP